MKKSALAAGLKAAAGRDQHKPNKPITAIGRPAAAVSKTVLIGGHYAQEVRRTLFLVQAEPENAGKNLKQLLGEAINDLCAKYGKPQPYAGEE
jgi:hypothetical protein